MKEMSLHKNLVSDLEEAKARISALKPLEATLKTLKQQNQEKDNIITQLQADVKEYKEMVALKVRILFLYRISYNILVYILMHHNTYT